MTDDQPQACIRCLKLDAENARLRERLVAIASLHAEVCRFVED